MFWISFLPENSTRLSSAASWLRMNHAEHADYPVENAPSLHTFTSWRPPYLQSAPLDGNAACNQINACHGPLLLFPNHGPLLLPPVTVIMKL
jgi:hypothetical protein